MKAYLINIHLLVPWSRSSAKFKVKYKGYISQKMAISGGIGVSQTHLVQFCRHVHTFTSLNVEDCHQLWETLPENGQQLEAIIFLVQNVFIGQNKICKIFPIFLNDDILLTEKKKKDFGRVTFYWNKLFTGHTNNAYEVCLFLTTQSQLLTTLKK